MRWTRSIPTVLEMIKFQHSVFALPFALGAMLAAAGGLPSAWTIAWILAACVFARSAAMAFNRWADRRFDAENPRTRGRALVTGDLTPRFALGFTTVCAAGFVFSAAMLNALCLWLSPLALALLLGYSFVKRFSDLTHLFLGAALGLAPLGAWIAVRGALDDLAAPVSLALAVMLWTAGFDIIYACQDVDFDRRTGLRSIPGRLGVARALGAARGAHLLAFAGLLSFCFLCGEAGWATLAGTIVIGGFLAVEHSLVGPDNLTRVNVAFFTMNGLVSFAFMVGVGVDTLLLKV